jgi:hypothetical protein
LIAMTRTMLVCALAAALTGCYKANIHLTDGPGSPGAIQDQMHFSVIGIFEVSSPIDLRATCPSGGPAVIREQVTVVGGIINLLLGTYLPILSVMNPSVDCAGGGAPTPAPPT